MKFNEFIPYVRKRTKTDTVSFPSATMMLFANVIQERLATYIIKANENYFVVPATADLVANQREYPFPAGTLSQIKGLEVKFNASDNYINAREVDLNTLKIPTNEAAVVATFDNNNPYYSIIRGSLWLWSGTIANCVAGLKLWYTQYPADFTSTDFTDTGTSTEMEADPTSTTFGLPIPFHKVLADMIVREYKILNSLPLDEVDAAVDESKTENAITRAVDAIRGANLSREIIAQLPSAEAVGNNGFDY